MNRILTLTTFAILAVSLGAGCGRSQSDGNGPAVGPITDSADTGLRSVAGAQVVLDPKHGAEIFSANCQSCHGAGGVGGGVGPRLIGEKSRKDQAAAVVWIKNPVAPMPKLYPAPLGERDVADVASYVESL